MGSRLRAIAIILVVLFHYVNFRGGFIGVDVFFVISGYLITSIITEQLEENRFTMLDFYKRRIKRIFPTLITVLLSCLIFGWFSLLATEYKSLVLHISTGTIFLSNFLLLNEIGYFDTISELKPLLHLWSLSIEEQFYIIWPALIMMCYKFKIPIRPVIISILILSFAYNIYEAEISKSGDFYLPTTRFWELAIGGALYGNAFKKAFSSNRLIENIIPIIGILLIFSCLFIIKKSDSYPSWQALIPTIGAALIITSSKNSLFNKYILGSKPLVLIGLISFPLYLWHWPILSFLRIISEEGGLKDYLKISAISLSFILAYITYTFIEKPIRFSSKPNRLLELIITMIITGAISYSIYCNQGIKYASNRPI